MQLFGNVRKVLTYHQTSWQQRLRVATDGCAVSLEELTELRLEIQV